MIEYRGFAVSAPSRRLAHPRNAIEIPALLRWRDTELAIAALSLGFPTRPVELCFLLDGELAVALPCLEFGRHYDLPPEYVLATWT